MSAPIISDVERLEELAAERRSLEARLGEVSEEVFGIWERSRPQIEPEEIETRAREICSVAGLDPDFMAIEGWDEFGTIREPNWKLWADQAEDELLSERRP